MHSASIWNGLTNLDERVEESLLKEPPHNRKSVRDSGCLLTANDPFFEIWAKEMAGLQSASTDAFFQRCHEDIQVLLAYTFMLNASNTNPFQRALNLPWHPRMNLI